MLPIVAKLPNNLKKNQISPIPLIFELKETPIEKNNKLQCTLAISMTRFNLVMLVTKVTVAPVSLSAG